MVVGAGRRAFVRARGSLVRLYVRLARGVFVRKSSLVRKCVRWRVRECERAGEGLATEQKLGPSQ